MMSDQVYKALNQAYKDEIGSLSPRGRLPEEG
jgi:hypothetical protein